MQVAIGDVPIDSHKRKLRKRLEFSMPTLKGPEKKTTKNHDVGTWTCQLVREEELYQYQASHAAPSHGPYILLRFVGFSQICWLLADALISPRWDLFGGCFLSSPIHQLLGRFVWTFWTAKFQFFESGKVPFKSYPFLNWNCCGSEREIKMNINYDIGSVGMVYLPTWMA